MKNDIFPKYFLAANACGGFYSEFNKNGKGTFQSPIS